MIAKPKLTPDEISPYPFRVRARQLVERSWRYVARAYGYEEYDVETEPEAQYRRRYDIVEGSFGRPARRGISQLFRYEHVGCDSPRADVEAIAVAKRSLDAAGLKREAYRIRVNDYQLLRFLLTNYLELDTIQTNLLVRLLAEKRTIEPSQFRDKATEIVGRERAADVLHKLSKLLLAKTAEDLPETIQGNENYQNLVALYERLEKLGIRDVILDITLAHPEYTNGLVFDFSEFNESKNVLLFKGGRYLSSELKSKIGAQGDMLNIVEALARQNSNAPLESFTDVYIVAIGDVLDAAEEIAEMLRSEHVSVEVDYTNRPADRQFKEAVKKRVGYVMTVDSVSVNKRVYALQNLRDGSEKSVSFERIVTAVSDRRSRGEDDEFDLSEIL